ncbi:MAG: glycine--tRNA ligase subunit beta, partial [Gloeomargaritaceae cyanobacterium C42_A2020_066]|nr:glycine--tRNA ligase subunit beta [Gloeomargaritaceae cyanobacterium C42_A2020_066]
ELPARFFRAALVQWQALLPAQLAELHLEAKVQVLGTPRRLALVISDLPAHQPDQVVEAKGPAVSVAFKGDQPTPAALGFARSQGVPVETLEIRETPKGPCVFAVKTQAGRPTAAVLQAQIQTWITALEGPRFMAWGEGPLRFARPVRGLVALWEDQILPVELVNGPERLTAGRTSAGHRVLHPQPIEIPHAAAYVDTLRQACVLVDRQERQQVIRQALETTPAGRAEIPPDLLEEVTDLVEWPTPVVGSFEPEYLELPDQVVTTVMITHQRYFPLRDAQGQLQARFLTISNGDPDKADLIAAGNARVLRARLADAAYFLRTDWQISLADYVPRLAQVTFQEKLGTILEKVERIEALVFWLTKQVGLKGRIKAFTRRAAHLCKADLVTQMVGEFPELQGTMGRFYAITSGEGPEVATAIAEHYLPRFAGDALPTTPAGQLVALADRLDTLAGIFSLGLLPTGSSDPFALRRAGNALWQILWSEDCFFSNAIDLNLALEKALGVLQQQQSSVSTAGVLDQLREFLAQRARTLLQEDRGIDYDLVNAVLVTEDAELLDRALAQPRDLRDRAHFLQSLRNEGTLASIYAVVNRAARLASQGDLPLGPLTPETHVDPAHLTRPVEQELFQVIEHLGTVALQAKKEASYANYTDLVAGLQAVAPVLNRFFDGPESVLVMDPDPAIRQNRLNLLGLLRNQARVLADFRAIVKD